MDVLRLGRLSDDAFEFGGADELGFAPVPFGEDFGGGCTAEDARVDEARKADVGDVAAGTEDAFEVPDGFGAAFGNWGSAGARDGTGRGCEDVRIGVDLVEEASTVAFVEDSSETPRLLLEWLYVLNLDNKDITWLGALHFERPAQIMDFGKVDVLHVVCAVIVPNLTSSPINTLDLDNFSIVNLLGERNCQKGQSKLR